VSGKKSNYWKLKYKRTPCYGPRGI